MNTFNFNKNIKKRRINKKKDKYYLSNYIFNNNVKLKVTFKIKCMNKFGIKFICNEPHLHITYSGFWFELTI